MAAEETKPRHLELADYIRIASKRKWFILIVTAAAVLIGGLHALSTPKRYQASALVLIRQRPQGFFWVSGEEASMAPAVAMETYARIASSSDVAARAAEALEALPPDSRIIATPAEIQGALDVSVIKPDLLRIDATSADERKARYFANAVAEAFVQVNTEDRQMESRVAREFLEEQVELHRRELDAIMARMADLARSSGYVDMESEVQGLTADLRNYENRMRQAEAELSSAQARLAELERTREREAEVRVVERPTPNPEYSAIRERLTAARLELETLTAKYTDDHPLVLDARALVAQLEEELARTPQIIEAPTVDTNPAIAGIENEIKAARVNVTEAQARLDAVANSLNELRAAASLLPEQRQQWQSLLDQANTTRAAYNALRDELRQAKLSEAIKQGNARVVDTSQHAREIKVSWVRAIAFAGALGLFVGLALAILLEALDDTIYSVEDLQRVSDLYLLGVIPARIDDAGPLVTITAPKSPPAEAYRTLRSNIRFSLFDKPARTLLVTSAGAGEGKSRTAANLAIVYAQSGDSVILVDADLRRPIIDRLFGVEAPLGVTNVLVGDTRVEDALVNTQVPGLRLLTAGPLPPNPAELLESERMTELIESLARLADLVILDSPPALMLTDAVILATKVDRTIVVAESGQVTERAIGELERLFRHARADVLGIVLNKLRITGGDYYYYYYYYYEQGAGEESQTT